MSPYYVSIRFLKDHYAQIRNTLNPFSLSSDRCHLELHAGPHTGSPWLRSKALWDVPRSSSEPLALELLSIESKLC